VAALLLGASPAYGDTSAESATRLAHAKAALTATRGQLTPEQWALLSDKLAGAEQALADCDQFVTQTGRTLAAAGVLDSWNKAEPVDDDASSKIGTLSECATSS
jgi:hypothetical protein